MKLVTKGLFLAALAVLALPQAIRADDRALVERKSPDKEPATDQEFLVNAVACNLAEIRFGEKALKESENKDVRKFAQQMIDDHTRLKDKFMKIAKAQKVAVVGGLEKDTREEMTRLSKLKGGDFDREYMQFMVEGHEKFAKLLHTWAKKATDSELRAVAAQGATKADEHLREAKEILAKLKRA